MFKTLSKITEFSSGVSMAICINLLRDQLQCFFYHLNSMPSRPLVSIPKPKIQYETLSVGIDSLSCLKLSLSRIALLRWLPKPNVGVQIRCTFYSDYSLKPAYVNYYCFDSRHATSPPIMSPPSQHPQPLPMALQVAFQGIPC